MNKTVLEGLATTVNIEKIIRIIEKNNIDISKLKRVITELEGENKYDKKLLERLKQNVERYMEYTNLQRMKLKNEQTIEELKNTDIPEKIITWFIESDEKSFKDFCQNNRVKLKMFSNCVKIAKENNRKLYLGYLKKADPIKYKKELKISKDEVETKEYENYIKETQTQKYPQIINKIIYISDKLKNGIEDNGEIREFDLVDYYECTNIPLKETIELAEIILNLEDKINFCKFINKNISALNNCIVEVNPEVTIVFFPEINSKGQRIPDTGYELSLEEKQKLINYLKNKKIPVNGKTYSVMLNRYQKEIEKALNNKNRKK